MLRGYRGIFIASVGLALIGASETPKEPAAPKQQHATQTAQPASPQATAPASEASKAVEPPEYYDPCAQAKDKGSSDLCAQWSAANAARNAADWAWWQMWLSGLGVLGLGVTLWFNFRALRLAEREAAETRGAVEIAERNAQAAATGADWAARAAEAASKSNAIAQERMQRELRPYVYPSDIPAITFNHILGFDILGDIAEVTIKFTNYGRTPARQVRYVVGGFIAEPNDARARQDSAIYTNPLIHMADVPPGSERTAEPLKIEGISAVHASILAGHLMIIVDGIINYENEFDIVQYTRFRYICTGDNYGESRLVVAPSGNHAS